MLCVLLMVADASLGDGLLYASSGRIRRVLAKRVKMKRRERKEIRRRKERALLEDRSGILEGSWQSTLEGSTISSVGSTEGYGTSGGLSPRSALLSPRTDKQIKNDYFRRLDILLRRKGGLS